MAGARQPSLPRLVTLAVLAMAAFAANSVLARLALDRDHIDAGTFTLVRLASGAVVLWLIVRRSCGSSGASSLLRGSFIRQPRALNNL